MTLKYLADKVKEYSNNSKDITVSSGEANDSFRSINFSGSFFQETAENFSTSITINADLGNLDYTKSSCADVNCTSCNDVECYLCKADYYLEDGICKNTTGNQPYFLSPGYTTADGIQSDITLANVAVTTNFTISLFMKFFARNSSSNSIDVLRFGTNIKLRLVYDSSATTAKLQLYSDLGSDCIIGDFGDFFSRFGEWTHISLAFYYDSAKLTYYPANLNFQVNFTPVKTVYSCYNKVLGVTPNISIVFPKESIALYASILIWDKYFTGVWGYQSYASNSKTPKDSKIVSSCPTETGKTINCYRDYTGYLKTADYCTTDPRFYTGSTCLTAQSKCPYGYFENNSSTDYCSCENKEPLTWVINKDDTRHYCKSNFKKLFKL